MQLECPQGCGGQGAGPGLVRAWLLILAPRLWRGSSPVWIMVLCREEFLGSRGLLRRGRAGLWLSINQTVPLEVRAQQDDSQCLCVTFLQGRMKCISLSNSLQGPLRASFSFTPSLSGIGMSTGKGQGPWDISEPPLCLSKASLAPGASQGC